MAVSIIAEIIQVQKRCPPENSCPEKSGAIELSERATDPVCGMAVELGESPYQSEYEGRSFYFCCAGCKQTFDQATGKIFVGMWKKELPKKELQELQEFRSCRIKRVTD